MNTHLVIGGTGKTGRRVVDRLKGRGAAVHGLSRPEFDWSNPQTWGSAEIGARAAYVTYAPEVAFPGAPDRVIEVVQRLLRAGTRRVVLLSGRGEPEAQRAEDLVRAAAETYGAEWAAVRSAFFMQNFDEGVFAEPLAAGELALPADDVREPFVDCGDVADVATALMLGDLPTGRAYEVTGPRLLTFAEVTATIARNVGRPIRYVPISVDEFVAGLLEAGLPGEDAEGLGALFDEVLDGHNAYLADGVREALGREPRDLADYARAAAEAGAWPAPVAGR